MASGRRQGSSSDLRARGRNSPGTEWKAEGGCVGRHVFHPVTPSSKLGRRLGWGDHWGEVGRGGYGRIPESRCGLDISRTSAASFWAEEVPWCIFLVMVLLTVVERGCFPHPASFPFSLISSPDASMRSSLAQPQSTCCRRGHPHPG